MTIISVYVNLVFSRNIHVLTTVSEVSNVSFWINKIFSYSHYKKWNKPFLSQRYQRLAISRIQSQFSRPNIYLSAWNLFSSDPEASGTIYLGRKPHGKHYNYRESLISFVSISADFTIMALQLQRKKGVLMSLGKEEIAVDQMLTKHIVLNANVNP